MTEYLRSQVDLNNADTVSAYDELPLWSAMFGLLLLRYVPLKANTKILDVGCGTGFPLFELAQRLGPGSVACGLDLWEAAVNRARFKMKVWGIQNVELHIGDASSMPFPDAEFDLIVSNLGINNFADPEMTVRECHRVLKPSGVFALTTNLRGHMKEFYKVFESTLQQLGKTEALPALNKNIEHRATIPRITDLLNRTGFTLRRVHEETSSMRFVNGSSLFRHYFIQLGFLDGWKGVVDADKQDQVFSLLESNLNEVASREGGLLLTIPMAYIEAQR